ncbi:MAG: hypothetical protein FWH15_03845 [Betaproteobacteria bacterium]|nr:hypothetical protein [Betaproteobacteria bacterium]
MKLENLSHRWQGMQYILADGKSSPLSLAEQIRAQSAKTEEKEESPEAIKQRRALITVRLRVGQKLSRSDLEFLKKHAEGLYREAVRAEEGRRQYEREIRACRSRKEVEAVRARWQQMHLTEIRAIERSNMSFEEKKLAKEASQIRFAAREDAHLKFLDSPAYMRLPDEEEDENSARGLYQEVIRKGAEKRATDMEGIQEKIMATLRDKIDDWEKMAGIKPAAAHASGQENAESGNDPAPAADESTISAYS